MTWADWIIIGSVAVLTILDIVLIVKKKKTISNMMRLHGKHVAMIPYVWGVLGGHFFGPNLEHPFDSWAPSIAVIVFTGLTISLVHSLLAMYGKSWRWAPVLYFLAGAPFGVFFWPQ